MPSNHVMLVDPSGRGGLVSYTKLVARAVAAAGSEVTVLGSRLLDPADYECRFVPRMPNLLFGSDQPTGIRFYTNRAGLWLGGASAVLRTTRELQPDIVHFQHAINRRLDERLLRRIGRRTALVWTAHDVLPHEQAPGDAERFAGIYRRVDAVIVHSRPAASALRELAGVDAVVLEHPVDDSVPRVARDDARRALGLPLGERILGALGFVRSYKGYDLLAETWQTLGAAAPRLLVMGEVHSPDDQAVIDQLAVSPRVEVRPGFASDRDLQLAVAACDALVLPYEAGSDSGLLHLGRALGTPVIASDAPQLSASVLATHSGLVVPRRADAWADALVGALPPPPATPPTAVEAGKSHLDVYRSALLRAAARLGSEPSAPARSEAA